MISWNKTVLVHVTFCQTSFGSVREQTGVQIDIYCGCLIDRQEERSQQHGPVQYEVKHYNFHCMFLCSIFLSFIYPLRINAWVIERNISSPPDSLEFSFVSTFLCSIYIFMTFDAKFFPWKIVRQWFSHTSQLNSLNPAESIDTV